MNKAQRIRNRETGRKLQAAAHAARLAAHVCENCGERGGHWISSPHTLEDILADREPQGFWTCHREMPDGVKESSK